jgi:hypothetical protein
VFAVKVAFKAFLLDRTCNTEYRGTVPTQVNITLRVGTKSRRGGLMDLLLIFASMARMAAEFHDFLRQRFIELVYAVYKNH